MSVTQVKGFGISLKLFTNALFTGNVFTYFCTLCCLLSITALSSCVLKDCVTLKKGVKTRRRNCLSQWCKNHSTTRPSCPCKEEGKMREVLRIAARNLERKRKQEE